MDKLAADAEALKISVRRRRREINFATYCSASVIFGLIWPFTYLFTDILHALGDNDITFYQIFGCLVGMELAPLYFVYKYFHSKELKLKTLSEGKNSRRFTKRRD